MSSNFGALSPLTDRINRLRQLGSQFLDHPIDTTESLLGMHAPLPMGQPTHEQEIQRMNQEMNSHRNDPANQSFQKPDLSTMKKPLGK